MDGSLGAPDKWYELLIVPGIAVFFGLLFRFLAWNSVRLDRKSSGWQWASLIALALGTYFGALELWKVIDPDLGSFYSHTIWSRKVLYSHYLAFGLPFLSLLAVLAVNFTEKRLGRPIAV